MDEIPQAEVQEIGHLGLVAAVVKKFKISEEINLLLPKESNNQKINHAQAILAMIYQGLGFGDGRLYFAKDFFSNKPMDVLFGKSVEASMFNDDVLGASLDAITNYGPTRFFTNIAFRTLIENNLVSRFAHLDSTTHSFHGRKYKDDKVKVNFGHSKGRADLPQVLQFLMTTESGLPFWTAVRSGNSSDREMFPAAINSIQNHIENIKKDLSLGFVADSALYSKKFLLNKNITSDWITRVPESIKLAKELVGRDHEKIPWSKLDEDYKYFEYKMTYAKVEQRWIVVSSRLARHKELATVEKNLKKEKEDLTKRSLALMKKTFPKKSEIYLELKKLQKSHPHHIIHFDILGNFKKGRGQRPRAAKGHRVYISFERNEELIKKIQNRKGKFIIATNLLNQASLPAEELIQLYLGRNANIERCFRVMKDTSLKLNQIFLKRVDRIQALFTVMTLCLFVHNLGQMEVRKSLSKSQQTIPNQVGKEITNPSLKWVFQVMQKIVRVRINLFGRIYEEFKEIGETQRKIIACFGSYALAIYGFL